MEIIHGTATGYSYHKCRCELCKAAWAKHIKEYRDKKEAEGFKRVKGKFVKKNGKNKP